MAKLVNLIISFMVVTLVWPGMIAAQEEKKKPVNERILEILIEKNIITKEQYEDLLKQAKEEESAEKERLAREKELQKKKEEGKKPMEEMHSDNWIDFIERSIANKIAPSRDVGMMFHGNISDDLFYYELGLFNGYKANTLNVDDGKDLAGRVVVAPFLKSGLKALEGLRLGGAFTYGNEDLTASQWWNSGQWKTAAGTTYMAMNNSVVQSGRRTRGGWSSIGIGVRRNCRASI